MGSSNPFRPLRLRKVTSVILMMFAFISGSYVKRCRPDNKVILPKSSDTALDNHTRCAIRVEVQLALEKSRDLRAFHGRCVRLAEMA